MSKAVIVTGGCGYIGSHVARAFIQQGARVHIIDKVRREHTLKGVDSMLTADYSDDSALALYVALQPDIIVHCAGTSLVGPSIKDPSMYWDNNVTKTIKMLDTIKKLNKKPTILFSSSASVYGNANCSGAIRESQAISPISPYGNTKATIERILHDYYVAYGIPSVCFRYFNAAGAEPFAFDLGQEPMATHIIARALEASISKSTFTLCGTDYNTKDGTCVRDYIHVWDLAQAHILGANLPGLARIYNLGTNIGVSNNEIVEYVATKYGLPNIVKGPRRLGDPDILIADATAANTSLGWSPQFSDLSTIIDTAYKWYTK